MWGRDSPSELETRHVWVQVYHGEQVTSRSRECRVSGVGRREPNGASCTGHLSENVASALGLIKEQL